MNVVFQIEVFGTENTDVLNLDYAILTAIFGGKPTYRLYV